MFRELIAIFLFLFQTVSANAESTKPNTVKKEIVNYIVTRDQSRPFQIENNGKNHRGIITDIVYEIFRGSNYKVVTHTYPVKRTSQTLETRKHPNWIMYGSPVWPPVYSENITAPLFQIKHSLLTQKSTHFTIPDVETLFGKTLVILFGFDYPGIDKYIKNKKINSYAVKDYLTAFRSVDAGRGLGFVEMKMRIKYNLKILKKNPNNYNFVDFSHVIPPYNIHIALDKQMPSNTQDFVRKRVLELKHNGFVKQTLHKYLYNQ